MGQRSRASPEAEAGSTRSMSSIGIRCSDGVVMGVEKPKLSKMLVEGSNRRIYTIDKHSGMCVSGLMADARQVVSYAREEANSYQDFYGGVIPGNVLCARVASLMHIYTLNWQVRPFGANALLASYT